MQINTLPDIELLPVRLPVSDNEADDDEVVEVAPVPAKRKTDTLQAGASKRARRNNPSSSTTATAERRRRAELDAGGSATVHVPIAK